MSDRKDDEPRAEKPAGMNFDNFQKKLSTPKARKVIFGVSIFVILLMLLMSFSYEARAKITRKTTHRITVSNKLSGDVLRDARLTYNGKTLETNKSGVGVASVSTGTNNVEFKIEADGFLPHTVTLPFSGYQEFSTVVDLVPVGKIYYFVDDKNDPGSNQANLVESNLDGSDKKVVLQGTGSETASRPYDPSGLNDDFGIVYEKPTMLANHNWKNLALLVRRNDSAFSKSGFPSTKLGLYMFNTESKKLVEIDKENSVFNFIGWIDNDHFAYKAFRNGKEYDEDKAEAIKIYDVNKNSSVIALESSKNKSVDSKYFVMGKLTYEIRCSAYDSPPCTTDKKLAPQFGILNADASLTPVDYPIKDNGVVTNEIYGPDQLYFSHYSTNGGVYYYRFDGNAFSGVPKEEAEGRYFRQILSSPEGITTFWTNDKDGTGLYTGDMYANQSRKTHLDDGYKPAGWVSDGFKPFGWVGEEYIILARNSGELYASGTNGVRQPIFISNFAGPSYVAYSNAAAGYPGASLGYGFSFK